MDDSYLEPCPVVAKLHRDAVREPLGDVPDVLGIHLPGSQQFRIESFLYDRFGEGKQIIDRTGKNPPIIPPARGDDKVRRSAKAVSAYHLVTLSSPRGPPKQGDGYGTEVGAT
jgi:hypothetical protein